MDVDSLIDGILRDMRTADISKNQTPLDSLNVEGMIRQIESTGKTVADTSPTTNTNALSGVDDTDILAQLFARIDTGQ